MHRLASVASTFLRLVRVEGGSRFRQNFLRIAKANVLVQAMGLALAPLLTRLYSPSDFGTAALFASLLGFVAAFATLRFEWSIPNATAPKQAAALLWLSLATLLTTSLGCLLVWGYCGGKVDLGASYQNLSKFWFLFPIALAGTGVQQGLLAWFTRENDLAAVGKAQIRKGLVGSAVSVTGGLLGLGPLGLIASSAISAWAGIGTLWRHAPTLPRHLAEQSRAELGRVFRQFAGESLVSSVVSVINIASIAIIPFLLASYYGPAEVGWYALMNRLALAPTQLFTSALARSFWSESASLVSRDLPALRRLYLTTARRLALAGVPVAVLCACGPLFVAPVFGQEWRSAGYILLALAPGVVSQLVAQPITHLIVHRKQHWKLYLDAGKLAAIFGGVTFLAHRKMELHYVVWWLSFVDVVGNAVLFSLNLRCVSRPPQASR